MHRNLRPFFSGFARMIFAAALLLGLFTTSRAAPGVPPGPGGFSQMVTDINTMNSWSAPQQLAAINNAVYFSANDGAHGLELWRSEGTPQTTRMVIDLAPGPEDSAPSLITRLDGTRLIFATVTMDGQQQVWVTDGTVLGTLPLKSFFKLGYTAFNKGPVNVGNTVYFAAADIDGVFHLWRTEGTAESTVQATTMPLSSIDIEAFDGWLYFAAEGPEGSELYRTNPSAAAPERITNLCQPEEDCGRGTGNADPFFLSAAADRLYFLAYDAVHGSAAWSTTGKPASLTLAADIVPGAATENEFYGIYPAGSGLFMVLFGNLVEDTIWYSAGTAASAHPLTSSDPDLKVYVPNHFTALGSALFFSATTNKVPKASVLFRATATGLEMFGAAPKYIDRMAVMGSSLYFTGETASGNPELWKITETGTPQRVAPFTAQTTLAGEMVGTSSRLYFPAVDPLHGLELWTSDGSEAGTSMLMDINPYAVAMGAGIQDLSVVYKDSVFFTAVKSNTEYYGLWRTDGSAAGTVQLTPYGSGSPLEAAVFNNLLYFIGPDRTGDPKALYSTDGTKDRVEKEPGAIGVRYLFGGERLFFAGSHEQTGAFGLWAMNAGDAQPKMVLELGDVGSFQMGVLNGVCVLERWSAEGWSLWRSDGTPGGTRLLYGPVQSGANFSYNPQEKRSAVGGRLFFALPNPEGTGEAELYATDGVTVSRITGAQGTPTNPAHPLAAGGSVYFGGTNGDQMVLWKLPQGSTQAEVVYTSTEHMGEPFNPNWLPVPLADLNGQLVFRTGWPQADSLLWLSDGTPQGTAPLCPGCGYAAGTHARPVVKDGRLYFAASDTAHGTELWISDGTSGGTGLFHDVRPGPASSSPDQLFFLGEQLLFTATDGVEPGVGHGRELWRYDPVKIFLPVVSRR